MTSILGTTISVLSFLIIANSRTLRGVSREDGSRPNIVWILADDLHYEVGMYEHMPNLGRLKDEGIEFVNHASQSPLCGPSRASLLVGRYPHRIGYKNQGNPTDLYLQLQNQSVGAWLTKTGYYTAYLGKYVNGLAGKVGHDIPGGWRYFGGFTREWDPYTQQEVGGAYNYYNASQWDLFFDESGTVLTQDTSDYPIKIRTGIHQADFLGEQTVEVMKTSTALGMPFFIFVNPVMVHHGSCEGPFESPSMYRPNDPYVEAKLLPSDLKVEISPCPKRDRDANFLKGTIKQWTMHTPGAAYLRKATGQKIMGQRPCEDCPTYIQDLEKIAEGRRNRTASALDLDDMVGTIIFGLLELGQLDNTYVIFTSDNGFHLGEHGLFYGKEHPYEHDIRVPLIIRTPQRISGVRTHPTTHVDLTRTIVDIAQAKHAVIPSVDDLDGKSFFYALTEFPPEHEYRTFTFSEMFEDREKTWRYLRHFDSDGKLDWTMSFWCTGEIEVFTMSDDQYQMMNSLHPSAGNANNAAGELIKTLWLPVLNGLGTCSGWIGCNNATIAAVRNNANLNDLTSVLPCETFGHKDRQ